MNEKIATTEINLTRSVVRTVDLKSSNHMKNHVISIAEPKRRMVCI